MHRALALGLLSVSLGCSFRSELPTKHLIHCEPGGAPCPAGSTCRPAVGRCVDDSLLGQPPASAVNVVAAPAQGNAQATFTLDFQVTAPLDRAPEAWATGFSQAGQPEAFAFACDACGADLRCHCAWTPDPAHLPRDGQLELLIALVDVAGNAPKPAAAALVEFDTTPPALLGPPTVGLTAPPGVDTPVSALGNGAGVELCFGVSEALRAAPEVWAGPEDGGLRFALQPGSPQGLSWCYAATLAPGLALPDGPLEARAACTDLAGNAATLLLAEADGGAPMTVDRTPPQPPDLSEATGLRYHRAPWGELPDVGSPRLALVSGGTTLPEPATVVVYADPGRQAELGRAFIAAGAPVEVPLHTDDQPALWVDLVDVAGNRLAEGPVQVRSVDWVVNLGRKVKGDALANPHDCYARAQAGPSLLQPDDPNTALDERTGPTGHDGGGAVSSGAASWRRRADRLSDPLSTLTAFDPARGLLTDVDNNGQTASFDGLDWSVPGLARQPGARNNPGIAFDQARGRVVLFGGQQVGFGTSPTLCDTWELGPSGWASTPCAALADGGTMPPGQPAPRTSPVMGYDPARRWTLVFGGFGTSPSALRDAWAWDGDAWTELPPPPAACPSRGLVYDEGLDGGALVAFGTLPDGGATTCVGRWDGQGYAWAQPLAGWDGALTPTQVVVDPRTGSLVALVLDVPSPSADLQAEIWRWDGTSISGWQRAGVLPPPNVPNPADVVYGLSTLPERGVGPTLLVVMAGGAGSEVLGCALEPFACSDLPAQSGAQAFPGIFPGQLAFDQSGHGLVLGAQSNFFTVYNYQAWDWWAGTWHQESGAPELFYAGLGYWPGSDEFWAYGGMYPDGGLSQDLWVRSGDGGWSIVGADPTYQHFGLPWLVEVPDAGLPGLIAAGWGGPTMLLTEQGGALHAVALNDGGPQGFFAYDAVRRTGVVADFTGTLWEGAPPRFDFQPVAAQPLANPQLIFDPPSGALLAVGGQPASGVSPPGTVSRWDGVAMTPLPLTDPDADGDPDPFYLEMVGYDPAARRTRQLAVAPAQGEMATWELSLADSRPAVVCQFRFAAARAPAGATLTGVQVQARASGLDPDGGAGAALALWSRQAWREVQRCASAPCDLDYSEADPLAAGALLDDLQTLGVEVSPGVDNGPGLGRVEVDAVQATLSYRLP